MPPFIKARRIYLVPKHESPGDELMSVLRGLGVGSEDDEITKTDEEIEYVEVAIPILVDVDDVRVVSALISRPELCGSYFFDGEELVINRPYLEMETVFEKYGGRFI